MEQTVSRKIDQGPDRRKKIVRRLTAACAKGARKRLDWAQHQTAALAGQYARFATEELTLRSMIRSFAGTVEESGRQVAQTSGLHREVLDTARWLVTSLSRVKVLQTGGQWVVNG